MIITPRELALRAELYHQMSSMVKAGLGLPSVIEQLAKHPPKRSFREPLNIVVQHLRQGNTFSDSLAKTGDWVTQFDTSLIEAGERSGRLPECFQMLSDYYRERAELANSLIQRLAYPVFLFHFATLIFPVSSLVALVKEGAVLQFVIGKIFILGPVYALVFLTLLAGQGRHGEGWRAFVEKVLHMVPVLGKARRSLAMARLAAALEALLMAGVNTIEAWMLASAACGSPAVHKRVLSWKRNLENGDFPSELVNKAPEFPELFGNLYHSGEVSGKLDESLGRIYTFYQEEGSRKMRNFLTAFGVGITILIMLGIAFSIITFYIGMFQQIGNAAGTE
ncbi:MAG: type secretory pathway protein [Verrucomicrobia bacterium]|jgi:type IV pilus assembly protein PilC|nr:type secretory pathway protein [Verrucomicrobiota bacterium]